MFGAQRQDRLDGVQHVFVLIAVNDTLCPVSIAMMVSGECIEIVM